MIALIFYKHAESNRIQALTKQAKFVNYSLIISCFCALNVLLYFVSPAALLYTFVSMTETAGAALLVVVNNMDGEKQGSTRIGFPDATLPLPPYPEGRFF